VAHSLITPDIQANGRHIRALMRDARDAGVRLVQFPECAMSGYCKTQVADWDQLDWAGLQQELTETAALARRLGLWVVLGSAHRLTGANRPHNSLYVIDEFGELHGRYDKRLCSHTEIGGWFTPGREPLCFTVDGFTFGCALCIEICFPELFAEYERLRADCVLVSAYSQDPFYGVMAQAHAGTNCIWVGLSVPAQCAADLPAQVIGPNGACLSQSGATPGLVLSQLDRGEAAFDVALDKARPWRRAAREGQVYADSLVEDPRSTERLRL
jgi:predicted amidohydrolase